MQLLLNVIIQDICYPKVGSGVDFGEADIWFIPYNPKQHQLDDYEYRKAIIVKKSDGLCAYYFIRFRGKYHRLIFLNGSEGTMCHIDDTKGFKVNFPNQLKKILKEKLQ